VIDAIKTRCKALLRASGHYGRRLRETRFAGVAVLCYHGIRDDGADDHRLAYADLHVRAAELDQHCRLLRAYCDPISLTELAAAWAGDWALPDRPVLLTFDDGYQSWLRIAAPILARYSIPAVAFVCSGPVERRSLIWYDAIARTRGEDEVERLKAVPYDQWKTSWAETRGSVDPQDPNACLSIDELRQLARQPGWEIGGHTDEHCILAQGNREQQWEEISTNRAKLQAWTGRDLTSFCYPNGRPGIDFTAESRELVRQAGYRFAFCTRHGFATMKDEPLELPRMMMLAGISGAELAHRLCYSWQR
jgi:peptidoglycan/xylan/chitin deacetylase (PgdA/CDA1 family)